jgi:hypothetical protein
MRCTRVRMHFNYLSGLRGEEPGVGADVAGEADVGDDVGGDEEVEAVLVGVEGRVQRRVQRLLDDLAEVGRADVQQRPREAPHRLLDRPAWPVRGGHNIDYHLQFRSQAVAVSAVQLLPEVPDFLVTELGGHVADERGEGRGLAADGGRPAAGEVGVDGVEAVPQSGPAEELRLQVLQVQRELQQVHVRLRQQRPGRGAEEPAVGRPRPLAVHVLRLRKGPAQANHCRRGHHDDGRQRRRTHLRPAGGCDGNRAVTSIVALFGNAHTSLPLRFLSCTFGLCVCVRIGARIYRRCGRARWRAGGATVSDDGTGSRGAPRAWRAEEYVRTYRSQPATTLARLSWRRRAYGTDLFLFASSQLRGIKMVVHWKEAKISSCWYGSMRGYMQNDENGAS